ncbi:DUF3574 domain-containing protein [Aliidiomarina celeris]|uniref:DUF3574 domain-containing protein n=1 Tax=Aliidiomarina celeris TaxID=2249428 RepID=UPI000DE96E90|nr:DUF3574 domain-containing protein [Aliidiomarina celeris]
MVWIRIIALMCFFTVAGIATATEHGAVKVQMYFGLNMPQGEVSVAEWMNFEKTEVATRFNGFNVVDSVGYYQGQAEKSKIITLIIPENELPKVKELATVYTNLFEQDSVMVLVSSVEQWLFIPASQ